MSGPSDTRCVIAPVTCEQPGVFSAPTTDVGMPGLFGGELLGLGVSAVLRSVPDLWAPQTVQAHFLAPGAPGEPVQVTVSTLRDGKRTCHRRALIRQGDLAVAELTVVCAALPEPEVVAHDALAVSGPDRGDGPVSLFASRWNFAGLDIRVPADPADRAGPYHPVWVRDSRPQQESELGGWPVTAFVSDLGLVLAALEPGERRTHRAVSTDHVVWFHAPPAPGSWQLLDVRRDQRHGSRALVTARIHDQDGLLLATVAQGVTILGPRG